MLDPLCQSCASRHDLHGPLLEETHGGKFIGHFAEQRAMTGSAATTGGGDCMLMYATTVVVVCLV